MNQQNPQFTSQIQSLFGVQKSELTIIENFFEKRCLKKDDFLQKQGSYHGNLAFVSSGYIRMLTTEAKSGKEITQWIATEGTFVTDIACLFFGAAARWDIQALTDCEVLYISKSAYNQMVQEVPNWNKIEKLFIGKCFGMIEDRLQTHLSMTSEERYNYFFDLNPSLFNEVPLQYIASMLGMTPETFSRIRKKLSS